MDGQLVLYHKVLDGLHAIGLEEVLVDVVHKLVNLVTEEVVVEVLGHELALVLDPVVDVVDTSDL
eukprot:12912362-Prorocentrum_lima.AAC.1